jgi:hypothetical protein
MDEFVVWLQTVACFKYLLQPNSNLLHTFFATCVYSKCCNYFSQVLLEKMLHIRIKLLRVECFVAMS